MVNRKIDSENPQVDADTEGHVVRRTRGDEQGDDAEGHRVRERGDDADTEGHRVRAREDDADTEGHLFIRQR